MDLGVKGKSYIVLGGSRGMGYETARILAAEGARLTLMSRTLEQVTTAGKTLEDEFGIEVLARAADGMVAGEVDKVVEESVERFGAPRGLLVTSGLTYHNGTILDIPDSDWEYNFQDVMMGHVRVIRAALPHMISAGGGSIVTTAAYSARAAKSFLFPYASLKAALVNFTKNLAKTYGAQGIRANCICPGTFETVRLTTRINDRMKETGCTHDEAERYYLFEVFKMPVALGRAGQPQEIADVMAFCLSERAQYMTGATINVDGGTDF